MNEHTEYQVIEHDGAPAFVLVPVDEFERIRPLLERERVKANIPQAVVEAHVTNSVPLIKAWREHLGLTQEDVANRSGMAQSAIARIERGESSPRRATVERLAKAMGLAPAQVLAD